MSAPSHIQILPYTLIVGQRQQKLALELAYISQRIGGVLLSGQRGTGKSTLVRAFAQMMYDSLPVTLPINATEDRVVGGWKINELMESKAVRQKGLLEEADGTLLYIDEVNLLDDHIVNIILDVTSTGVLVVQRDSRNDEPKQVSFTLVGTMNPEEGNLRPQLLDRFGLMVDVTAETDALKRAEILKTVLQFDQAMSRLKRKQLVPFIQEGRQKDEEHKTVLEKAKENLDEIEVPEQIVNSCVALATEFEVEGNRGDYMIALAARAYAARAYAADQGTLEVTSEHIKAVAPLAIQHRRPEFLKSDRAPWGLKDDQKVAELLNNV